MEIRKSDLKPWLRERKYSWPIVGFLLLAVTIAVIPFIVLWRNRDEIIAPIVDAVNLALMNVNEN